MFESVRLIYINEKTNKKKLETLPSAFTLALGKVTIPRFVGKDFAKCQGNNTW